LTYVAGILPQTKVWAEGRKKPHSVEKLARELPDEAWREVQWREGTAKRLSSRFARIRVRAAHREALPAEDSRAEEWLLVEWPSGEKKPTKYSLTTLSKDISFAHMVDTAKLRWRVERDYEELKQEVGLGHFEGRGWRGFHHHATLCIATYGFLISEKETIPPSGSRFARRIQTSSLPEGPRPRGPPLRPQRHIPNSIATLRWRLVSALTRKLPRCPCCHVVSAKYRRGIFMMQ
jgi:Transposase DDE domain